MYHRGEQPKDMKKRNRKRYSASTPGKLKYFLLCVKDRIKRRKEKMSRRTICDEHVLRDIFSFLYL